MNAEGLTSGQAQAMLDDLSVSIGRYRFASPRAEVASELHAITPFVGLPSARFLLLFVSFESLFEPRLRSDVAQEHVQSLIEAMQQSRDLTKASCSRILPSTSMLIRWPS
jgi:hypothetical protein